ncbi:MAG: hypothetical protein JXO44_14070 [Clostridia bacterium]|nr:hypothetical protein [Clostridia bacterium]
MDKKKWIVVFAILMIGVIVVTADVIKTAAELKEVAAETEHTVNRGLTAKVTIETSDTRKTQEIDWDAFETKLYEASSLKEVIELYTPRMDGAYSEGYSAVVYDYYRNLGAKEFVRQLAESATEDNLSGVISRLTGEMGLYYDNDGEIDLEAHKAELDDLSKDEDTSSKEQEIINHILVDMEAIIKGGI